MKIVAILIQVLTVCCLLVHSPLSGTGQADRVPPALSPDSGRQVNLADLPNLNLKQAFNELKESNFLVNERLMNEAVLTAFWRRTPEALELACQYIRLPIQENIEGKTFSRAMDFYIAKSILQAFPDAALKRLTKLYDSTRDAITRGNIVLVLGGMEHDPRMWELLLDALEDKETYGGNDPEAVGYPLRVCDLAYNQIVAQYEIKDALRTIGNAHAIDVRDYHINRLKKLISN
jgi:hypothetical protein